MHPKNMYVQQLHYKKPERVTSFPHILPFLQERIEFRTPITIIVGENGTGKSTLVETIAALVGLNMEGGSKNHRFFTNASHSDLHTYCSLSRGAYQPKDAYFYRAETFYNLISDMDKSDGFSPQLSSELFGKDLHSFSRGEAMKELINGRFFGNGFYLMDEPETGLSAESQLHILFALKDLVERQSQFIFATHSPILLLYPGAQILELDQTGLKEKKVEETKLYQDWHMILGRGTPFIEQLFS